MTMAEDPAPPHVFTLRLDDELALRLRERHHAAEHYRMIDADREHLGQWFTWGPTATLEDVQRWLAAGLEQFRRGDGWAADLCWRGQVVGSMHLHFLDGPGGSTEIGYWLASAYQGRGLVTRAIRGLLRHFYLGRGLGHVSIGLDPRNARSYAVVERLGFRPEAVLRRAHGDFGADLAFFGLLREEWEAQFDEGHVHPPVPLPRFALRAGDELELALFERDDAEALAALVKKNQDHLRPWMPWALAPSLESTRGFIEGRALKAIAEADGFEAGIWWRGRLVGAVGVHDVSARTRRGSIGYWIDEEAQGHGVVTRAVRAVMARCFEEPFFDGQPFQRLDIRADVANARSRRVAERLGFTYEGAFRRGFFNGREYVDQAVYGMLREEWESSSATRNRS